MELHEGTLKVISVAATAGNVAAIVRPPDGKKYKIVAFRWTLVCDATVANRFFLLSYYDGSSIIGQMGHTTAITASQTKYLDGVPCTYGAGAPSAALWGIGDMIISYDVYLQMNISSGVAGDSYTAKIIVLEIPE